ncbi:trna guanylyltransferase [Stylonychia lemnae]|uniref:tRNA(His) guanylyltransferase n=1 Tax=Stylonychia lemnae TaxID=5949 RepID=A0A078B4S6_STYLE|nr:trna guanylyltransferase [Stylonychia lemnae]|eukprot:CDW89535.1 trna guanylyltransferase [Stylonychia lemnae]
MANSKFEYVKKFEHSNPLLPSTYMVVRIDGRGFTNFTNLHNFEKPNDIRGLQLMNKCAKEVMKSFTEIIIAYGDSDEYSFAFKKSANVFNRREDKILSCVLSLFSTSYVFFWSKYFGDTNTGGQKLLKVPSFDARIVLYPSLEDLQNYLSWRQVDCHINNQYNTCFWTIVQKGGLSTEQAQKRLKGTLTKDKNEILFSEFGINYNTIDEIFKRGSIWIRMISKKEMKQQKSRKPQEIKEQIQQRNQSEQINLEEEKKNGDSDVQDLKGDIIDMSLDVMTSALKISKKELLLVHDDLVEKPAFYEKYELIKKLK